MRIFNNKGIGVVGAILAVLILASFGAGVAYLSSSNQQAVIQQVTANQSFYTVQAGMEYGIGQILKQGWTGTSETMQFSGEDFTITRSGGTMTIVAAENEAYAVHSITDPEPPTMNCLIVDTTGAYFVDWSPWHLFGITLRRDPSCTATNLVVTGMSGTTWEPDMGESLVYVELGDSFTHEFLGEAPNGGEVVFQNNYTISDDSAVPLTLRWTYVSMMSHDFQLHFQYTYNGQTYETIADVDFLADNQAGCFLWNTGNARLTKNSSLFDQLAGTTVANNCEKDIRIDKLTVSWSPSSPSRTFNVFRIMNPQGSGYDTIFNGSSNNGAVTEIDYILRAGTTRQIAYFRFSDEMLEGARNYAVTFTFSDKTTYAGMLNLFAANQNDCLNIDASNVAIDPSNLKQLIGITLTNTCVADVGIVGMGLEWEDGGTGNLRNVSIDDVDGNNTFNVNVSDPAAVDFGSYDRYLIDGSGTKSIQYIRFQNNIPGGITFTMNLTLADGTTDSVTFTPAAQTQNLRVYTGNSICKASERAFYDVCLYNVGSSPIVLDKGIYVWRPIGPQRTVNNIRINGSWACQGCNGAGSGDLLEFTNQTIQPGGYAQINKSYFNGGSICGREFTLTFQMGDGSSQTFPSFTPIEQTNNLNCPATYPGP